MQSMTGDEERLALPIGVDDFKEVRENGYYFVDKTELISDILRDRAKVFLFTRPRRFGKSLNLSMLDAFFNLRYAGNTWFDGLKISSRSETEDHKNTYPVICLNMKDLNDSNFEEFLMDFRCEIEKTYSYFEYLSEIENAPSILCRNYGDIFSGNSNIALLKRSVVVLCEMLELHHGKKPIILIDEYDHPINGSYGKDAYESIMEFLKGFYSLTLKSNSHMSFAALTGVMQIAKEGIFSGLNNLKVDNIFGIKFDERYGFTASEVEELCSYYGRPEKFEEAKEWYDGYRFGSADIYNPWSVLNYIDSDFVPGKYWAGTSGNDIIDTLLKTSDDKIFEDLSILGNGGTVSKSLSATVAMGDLKNRPAAIFSVLAVAGYLNAVPAGEDSFDLSIPNREMYSVFYDHISAFIFNGETDPYAGFLNALEAGDAAKVQEVLYNILSENYPFLLLKDEGDYHLILATMVLGRKGRYTVTVDRESGNGRHDIIMKTRYPRYPNIVVEVKKTGKDSEAESERLAHEALEQIGQKDYCKGLTGRTFLYGISFNSKKATVLFEETRL